MRVTRPRASTAADVLAALLPFGAAAEGEELVTDADPPAELAARVDVLHTGLRALLTSRKWIGCGTERRTAAPVVLNPAMPIPAGVALLCVEGDGRWDRIGAVARLDFPDLFAR